MADYSTVFAPGLPCGCYTRGFAVLELAQLDRYGNATDTVRAYDMVTVFNVPVVSCPGCGLSGMTPKAQRDFDNYTLNSLIRALPDRKNKWYGIDYVYITSTIDVQLQHIIELSMQNA